MQVRASVKVKAEGDRHGQAGVVESHTEDGQNVVKFDTDGAKAVYADADLDLLGQN